MNTIPTELLLEHLTRASLAHTTADADAIRHYCGGKVDALEALAIAACIPQDAIRAAMSKGYPPRKLASVIRDVSIF